MPIEPSSFPPPENAARPDDPTDATPGGGRVPEIRQQASEIIDAVLSASAPEQAAARDQLRQCLAAHPDRPEAALVEHLTALGAALTKFPGGRSDAPEDGRATSSGPGGSVRSRIEAVLQDRMLLTAFQPIRDLSNGEVVGAQALTRFLGDTGDQPADWFAEARDARL